MDLSTNSGASVSVSDDVFGVKYNEGLVHQIVTSYLAAKRSGNAAQKTRSEVRGGGAKPCAREGNPETLQTLGRHFGDPLETLGRPFGDPWETLGRL